MGDLDLTVHSHVRSSPKFSFAGKLPNEDQIKKNTLPGPGAYASIGTDKDKHRNVPQWNMGSPQYKKDRGYEKCPGPGSYQPPILNSAAPQRWGFGPGFGSPSQSRFPQTRSNSAPAPVGPGHYEVRGNLGDDSSAATIRSKNAGAKGLNVPGPGRYDASDKSIVEAAPRTFFGSSTRPNKDEKNKTPAPGTYRMECMMNGGVTKRTAARYTMGGKANEKITKQGGPGFVSAASTFK